jgi:hypothetical protein
MAATLFLNDFIWSPGTGSAGAVVALGRLHGVVAHPEALVIWFDADRGDARDHPGEGAFVKLRSHHIGVVLNVGQDVVLGMRNGAGSTRSPGTKSSMPDCLRPMARPGPKIQSPK